MNTPPAEITRVLQHASDGDQAAADQLWSLVYSELRRIASRELMSERADHTFGTTSLVHEAYLKMVDRTRLDWKNRKHFYASACRAMRQILVDHARRRNAVKRQTQKNKAPLDEAITMSVSRSQELVELDEALALLLEHDERLGQLVELRFFGGLTVDETADLLGISKRTAERDWKKARAYLYEFMQNDQ
ncbi:MAG: ECF-type sigma factor [Bacteroidota bacterium]